MLRLALGMILGAAGAALAQQAMPNLAIMTAGQKATVACLSSMGAIYSGGGQPTRITTAMVGQNLEVNCQLAPAR